MHPYIDSSSRWAITLRRLMGYPSFVPLTHSIAFCGSAAIVPGRDLQLAGLAADLKRDIVHLQFAGLDADAPCAITLAIRQMISIELIEGCRVYAASETAPIEILAAGRRWRVGPRLVLISVRLPPKAKRARGEGIAWRRWRQLVEVSGPIKLEGSLSVRPGGRLVDAIPLEALDVAA